MRVLPTLLITSLLAAGAACGGDDDATPATDPSTTVTSPVTTPSDTTPDSTDPATTAPDTTAPDTTQPGTSDPTTTPATTPATTPTTTPATTQPATTTEPTTTQPVQIDVRVYFFRGERLAIERRDVDGPAVLRGALTELIDGPSADMSSEIPAGTELRGVDIDGDTATVDLSREFESGGGTLSMTARVAQVVFTATQFDNVARVVFWLDGAPIESLGGEGLMMSQPWTRVDVARELTGGVLVETPRPGATVTSPFVATGEADVFEGDFPIEIRRGDEVLAVIAPIFGGAWGDWADFTATITVDAEPGPIELVAYDAGGCGDAPECPPIIETVVPLTLG